MNIKSFLFIYLFSATSIEGITDFLNDFSVVQHSGKSAKDLDDKKFPKDSEGVLFDAKRKNNDKFSKDDAIKGQEDKVFRLDAQLKDDRKSPVIKINKSAIAEYNKAKENKKYLYGILFTLSNLPQVGGKE